MHRVAAKFVPRLLTEEQKQNRVTVSQDLLDRSNTDENFSLLQKLKSTLKGRRFQTVEEIKENSLQDLRAIPQNTFQDAFQNWKKKLGAVYQE